MKLTTICDVSHVISYTRPSSPLFFFWGHREEGLGTRLANLCMSNMAMISPTHYHLLFYWISATNAVSCYLFSVLATIV